MIRWITEKLGTAAWGNFTAPPDAEIVDARDLLDKEGNDADVVRRKILRALPQLRSGQRIIVCCDYGMSRSNAIAAGLLALEKGISFEEAVRRVIEKTGEKAIKISVLST